MYLNAILYAFPPTFCKLVILLLFLEINNVSARFRHTVFCAMVVVVGAGASVFFYSVFPCFPIRSTWDFDVPGRCIDQLATFKATCVLGVVTDVLVIGIPIPLVWSLQMSTRKKLRLIAFFAVGSV